MGGYQGNIKYNISFQNITFKNISSGAKKKPMIKLMKLIQMLLTKTKEKEQKKSLHNVDILITLQAVLQIGILYWVFVLTAQR